MNTLEEVKEVILSENKFGIELFHLDYRDELSKEQITEFVLGEDFSSSLWDWEFEGRADGMQYFLQENEELISTLSDEDKTHLQDWIYEIDKSDPIETLAKNASIVLTLIGEENWSNDDQDAEKTLRDQLKEWKIPVSDSLIRDMVENRCYGGEVSIRVQVSDLNEARKIIREGGTVSLSNPEVGFHDRLNGSGYMVQIEENFLLEVKKEDFWPELDRGGYSWAEIVGENTPCGEAGLV